VKRGQVRWVQFTAPDGRRPAVILTRNSSIDLLNAVTVALVTTNLRTTPAHVYLDEVDGMPRACNVNLHGLQTIPRDAVRKRITLLGQAQVEKLEEALDYAPGFGETV
jgi:mRNA interferase MazF